MNPSPPSGPGPAPEPSCWRPERHPDLHLRFTKEGELRAEIPAREVSAPAPPEVLELLAACDGVRTAADVAALLSQPQALSSAGRQALARALLEAFRTQGLLREAGARVARRHGYAHPAIHRAMLGDRVRTDAFRRAIQARVRPGDVVVDVGAGTGVLSLFAAQAGAARVHAIERSELAATISALLALNEGGERVEVLSGEADEVTASRELVADVVVSEWLGQFALSEGMFPAVASARDRWLRPGGAMIPSTVELYLSPLGAGGGGAGFEPDTPAYWSQAPYGLSFGPLLELELERVRTSAAPLAADRLLAPPELLHRIDCETATPNELYFESEVRFRCARAGTLAGFVGHFWADLGGGVTLDTSPCEPQTHWQQHLFVLEPCRLEAGAELTVTLNARAAANQKHTPIYELSWTGPAGAGERRVYNER